MANFKRPDVYINEVLSANNVGSPIQADSLAAFVGPVRRGPLTPTLVTNWTEFTSLYGDFSLSQDLHLALYSFYANGGGPAYVSRVVGTSTVAAFIDLNNTAATPSPTLKVAAANPGAWGNKVNISVTAGSAPDLFTLIVRYDGVAAGNIVERFVDLTMDLAAVRYAPDYVNTRSTYLHLTDLAPGAFTGPSDSPAQVASVNLSGGADGETPTQAGTLAAVQALEIVSDPLVINLPGVTNASLLSAVINWAEADQDGFVVVDTPAVADDPTPAATLLAFAATLPASSYAGVYGPRITIADPIRNAEGAVRSVPAGASVVGLMLKTDAVAGPFKTPAGVDARIAGALGVERVFKNSELDSLNAANAPVNVLRVPLPNAGICVMGGRTLKPGQADRYIAIRRSLIFLKKSLRDATQFAIFQPNDSTLWTDLTDVCEGILNEYFQRGGLRGASPDAAFYVRCDGSVNTPLVIANGEVRVEVGVSLQYPAEFVVFTIGQFEGGSTASES